MAARRRRRKASFSLTAQRAITRPLALDGLALVQPALEVTALGEAGDRDVKGRR
jgi:hypothetical protein